MRLSLRANGVSEAISKPRSPRPCGAREDKRKCIKTLFLLFSFPFFLSSVFAQTPGFDHSLFDQFLKKVVNERGEVNYPAAAQDPSLLKDYLEKLKQVDEAALRQQWPREEKLAFWINAYHAGIIQAVLNHYPVKSLLEIPSVWDIDAVQVGSHHYSLNNLRQRELIGVFRDEKIDTALACGARSCPAFSREAYTGPRVEGQLFLAAQRFVNDPALNLIEPQAKKIQISKIFKWHAKDFKLDFSSEERDLRFSEEEYAVLSFLANYLKDESKVQYLEESRYKIKYLDFDWSLNEWRSEGKRA